MSSLFQNILFAILGLMFLGYLTFQLQGFFFDPMLVMDSPEEGAHLFSSRVEVKGRAAGAAFIALNGRQIFTDDEGGFEEELILPYGLNIIVVESKGRFGRDLREERMIYVTGR